MNKSILNIQNKNNIFLKIRRLSSHVGIYFLASIIPVGIRIAMNPLIALNMSPYDYAIVGFYNSFNGLFSPIITFYAFGYYTKRYFEVDEEYRLNLKATIIQSLVYFSILISIFAFLGLYIYMNYFNEGSSIKFFPYAFFSVFSIPLSGIISFKLVEFKMKRKSIAFLKLSVSQGIILAGLALFFVVLLKLGAFGRMSATFITALLLFIYGVYCEINSFRHKFDWVIFKKMLFFVWPLVISAMLHFFTNGYDRIYLERLGNEEELGFYVVAVQLVAMISFFQSALSNTFQPDIYKSVVNRNLKATIKYILVLIFCIASIVLIFVLIAPFVVELLTAGRYVYSTKYVRVLAFSQITMMLYFITNEVTIVLGYTKLALFNKIFGVVFTVLLYSFLISRWDFMGAALGNVISYVMMMFINVFFLTLWIRWKKWQKNSKRLI